MSAIAVEVGRQLRAGERFVYAYYGGIDKTAHERGFGEFYDAELRFADRLVADVREQLPPGAVLLVTADHGQVEVGRRTSSSPTPSCWRWSPTSPARAGSAGGTRPRGPPPSWPRRPPSATTTSPGSSPASRSSTSTGSGRRIAPPIASRLGDVALVTHAPVSFHDPADSGPFELVCRHGSLTSAEVLVPLLAGTR